LKQIEGEIGSLSASNPYSESWVQLWSVPQLLDYIVEFGQPVIDKMEIFKQYPVTA